MQTLTSRLREQLTLLPQPRTHSGLLQVIRELAQTVGQQGRTGGLSVREERARALALAGKPPVAPVTNRQACGGILFVESAALASAYVNHCLSLRGVVAARDQTVEQGIRELGANVLIVEYRHLNAEAITHRVTRFIAQPPNPPPTVIRELCELRSS